MWGDHQHGIRTCIRGFLDLIDRPTRALLPGAYNKRKPIRPIRYHRPGDLDHLEILTLIQMHALAGGAKDDIASNASLIPFRKVRVESVLIYIASSHAKRRGKR